MILEIFQLILFILLLFLITRLRFSNNYKTAYVVVLGDVGRSPRMLYHSLSLAKRGYRVFIFGYDGSTPHDNILGNESITIIHLAEPPSLLKKLPKSVGLLLKLSWLAVILFVKLCLYARPSHILIQNPPSIPSLMVGMLVGVLRGSRVVVDWHNYGHTIMALTSSADSAVVKVYKWMEFHFGRLVHSSMCVTEAMKDNLANNWNIKATTLYDRPPSIFKILSTNQKHRFFSQFSPLFDSVRIGASSITRSDERGQVGFIPGRPALVVSSTSWTPDEDFNILFQALDEYNSAALVPQSNLPNVVCIVTGKGPLKEHYTKLIGEKNWVKVRVVTSWLPADQYPLLLASCDLGVSLHWSSSGLDLPMKVVDMFGCGLPVCSVKYPCIGELVEDGVDGLLFEDHHQLSQHFKELLGEFARGHGRLEEMRRVLEERREGRGWEEQWGSKVGWMFE